MEGRRLSRRDFVLLASSAAAGFLLGGFFGYLAASKEIAEKTMTITQTKTLTKTFSSTKTKTITKTTTVTETITSTKTVTEKPTINIQDAKLNKGYVESAKDVEILARVYTDQKLDEVYGRYWNASIEGELNFKKFSQGYEARFFTQQEPGTQYVEFEVEKDGAKAKKQLSIDVGLSDEEIEKSSVKREGIKMLWRDLLESKLSSELEILEKYLQKENELLNKLNVEKVSRASGVYLRNLLTHLDKNHLDYSDISKSLGLILTSIPSRPWIVYGNFVENLEEAEFLIDGESAYLLSKFVNELDIGEKHLYAARAMVDQMLTIANWLRIDAFDVLEYDGKKLQLYDLTKQLFEKHLEFEGKGKRASVADDVLIQRWSDRKEVNKNKHIYYGLRQVELPHALLVVDPVNRRYAWEDDQEFLTSGEQPNGFISSVIKYPPHSGKALNVLSKWIKNYEWLNDELNEVLKNPEQCIYPYEIKGKKYCWNISGYLKMLMNPERGWNKRYFYNTAKEADKDDWKLYSEGTSESKTPIILYIYSILTMNTPKNLEEVGVDLASCYGSITGYPIYREYFNYPQDKRPGWIHGETSFILNNYDESLLIKRSNELLIIQEDTYSLNLLATRLNAAKKDGINFIAIILPSLEYKRTSLLYL